MRVRRVNRYYCDYCKKAGCSGYHIKKHEAHCTLNPDRKCGMCAAYGQQQPLLADLMALLPYPGDYVHTDEWECDSYDDKFYAKVREILPALIEAAGDARCPACIMAAFRQKKIPIPLAKECGWNFDEEVRDFWDDINEDRLKHENYGY